MATNETLCTDDEVAGAIKRFDASNAIWLACIVLGLHAAAWVFLLALAIWWHKPYGIANCAIVAGFTINAIRLLARDAVTRGNEHE